MVILQDWDSIYYDTTVPVVSWNDQPMTRLARSRLWSLKPEDYRGMPELDYPAGYVCVVRDARGNSYRLETVQLPSAFVDELLEDERRSFGIEVIAIRRNGLRARKRSLLARQLRRSMW